MLAPFNRTAYPTKGEPMNIGNGIAIAGVWIFAGLSWFSKDTSNAGKWIALLIAIGATLLLK